MHKAIDMATPRVIDMQLRELDEHGVVYKKVYTGLPLKVEYYLTPLGYSIIPIIEQLDMWGNKNKSVFYPKEAVSI
jgi:DNA-binding HxlR family transcriptional regulator